MNDTPFAPLGAATTKTPDGDKPSDEWRCQRPVPENAPEPPEVHPKLGRPSGRWIYGDASGRLLGFALRFDGPSGKQFRPLSCWRSNRSGRLDWRWEAWPVPRPLYGLDRLEIGDMIALGAFLGQRQNDRLSMQWSQVKPAGIEVRQSKTDAFVLVRVGGALRPRLEAARERQRALNVRARNVIIDEPNRKPFKADHYRHVWAEVRAAAGTADRLGTGAHA